MMILPITRSWIVSARARQVYLVCAILALALSATLIGTSAARTAAKATRLPEKASSVLSIVLIPEVFGAALLWGAMLYFWFGFDKSGWISKAFWIVCLGLFLPFFWALYYFVVYRSQVSQAEQTRSLTTAVDS